MWLEKNSKISKHGDVYFALKCKHYFYKLIFKYFVDSIFLTSKYKNFDFKLNGNKLRQTYKFTSLLKKIIAEKSTTTDMSHMVGLSTLLLIMECFRIDNMWSLFREGSCGPLIFQLPNRVWNWNFSFDKRWGLVKWSCYWYVFQNLKSNFWCLRNWKMTSAISVTCKENLFVKVSNRQYYPLLAHLGVQKTLLVVWLPSRVGY